MAEPLSPARLSEIAAKVERAHTEIGDVAAEGPRRRFRMSIPANPGNDTDLIVSEALKGAEDLLAEVDRRLPIEDVERFLKRERDEYETRGECWNTVDDVLDCFRLHMVTGTPLTEPRPEEGPSDASTGTPPLTEAEELRAEVERLNARLATYDRLNQVADGDWQREVDRLKAENARLAEERDLAVAHDRQPYPPQWAYDQACAALEKHRERADGAQSRIAEALDLASRLDPSCGRGRVQAFVSDLRRTLGGAVSG